MLPDAPVRFSTRTTLPYFLWTPSATTRATISKLEPAGHGTTIVIGLSIGHFVSANEGETVSAAAPARMAFVTVDMQPVSLNLFTCFLLECSFFADALACHSGAGPAPDAIR